MTSTPFYLSAITGPGVINQLGVGIGGIWQRGLRDRKFATPKLKAKTKLGIYYRFTFSRKANVYSLYVDGQLHLRKKGTRMTIAQGASWVLGMGRELDGKPGTAKKLDKNQKFIGDICEFQMWNRGFSEDSAAKRFFKNPYSIGRPTLFDYPINYRYTLKNGAKAKLPRESSLSFFSLNCTTCMKYGD